MNCAIILAAGSGQRMGLKKDKMLLNICGKPLFYYSLMAFNDHPEIDSITIVANKGNKKEIEKIIKKYGFFKVKKIIFGGGLRQISVKKGFQSIQGSAKKDDIILVHNGANPLPSQREITEVIEKSKEHGACITGHLIKSTIKEVNENRIIKTKNRKDLLAAETPQAAKFHIFKKAIENAVNKNLEVTDESMMFEAISQKVSYVQASEDNFKITNQSDYEKLKAVLGEMPEDYRIGLGQDSHMFESEKKGLTLGGIYLKDELKLKANSDGDVVLHAVFNALSQAIGDMSLGFYADEQFKKGIKDSKKYLNIILEKIKAENFIINTLGIMIEAASPKVDPIVSKLKISLSKILRIDTNRIGITATTGENCTIFGEGLGIQCFAITSLKKENQETSRGKSRTLTKIKK